MIKILLVFFIFGLALTFSKDKENVHLMFDFGNGDVKQGYVQIIPSMKYTPNRGYGFLTGYVIYSHDVKFTQAAGFYIDQLTVEITCDSAEAEIHYTTNCSKPDMNSPTYSRPILINSTTVLKARSYLGGLPAGKICSKTYLINEDITLSVVSLLTDADNLFDPDSRIYVNYLHDWERPVHFEFFETDGLQKVNY